MIVPLLLHPPKTGGTSIHNALIELYGVENVPMERVHRPLPAENAECLALHHQYHQFNLPENYPAVITVRNPYTRLWSLFRHRLRQRSDIQNKNLDAATLSLLYRRFLKTVYRRSMPWSGLYVPPCAHWMCDEVQHIVYYENFSEGVHKAYGIDINKFEHLLNTGAVTDTSLVAKFYTQGHLDVVNRICEKDFDMFGYTCFTHIDDLHSHTQIK